ncbi:Predicted arabinose efflux permease, MFS family [Enhydrobacter aerosaccus]|uniref:Predicted arabinose efflux permease, MFS family n=1 Tax=Enhydrobacter aerosaccus TaxID=225324 RepID=A0A1T4TFP3_9HYPH|nr:MFS transporter [Enhydrobacter aerosaccus]SKA39252.1 Predicted arabinose efflux permease, MFS family [Enhydrobacter aerosaccus]
MPASRRSLRGLDWFAFFVADVQTGFGPFVSVYLTAQKWTQVDIGLILSVAGVVSLIGQIPGGVLLDAARSERLVAATAVGLISASAIAYAAWPIFPIVFTAAALHAAASCLLGPAIAAMSLGLVGQSAIGERLGRNARFASIGAGLSAAIMGACGYFFETRSVFLVTAALLIPTWIALSFIAPREIDPEQAHGSPPQQQVDRPARGTLRSLLSRPLLVFGCSILLFHLANAAMLPLMGSVLTTRSSDWATILIAACMVGPQIVVALCSPWAGRQAQRWGRRPILLIGLAALPLRGLLFATVTDPYLLVLAQLLDGVTATVFSVMVPLTVADLTRGTGHFNLTQGLVGTMMGIGASLSPTLAGYITDTAGSSTAFLGLAVIAFVGLMVVALFMPETRPHEQKPPCHGKKSP